MNVIYKITLLLFVTLVFSCSTTDTSMREQGHTESYIQGFHDGRHSGMKEEGNYFEHYIRDIERFKTDSEYKAGWLAGEAEGKRLQEQANEIGAAASEYRINEEVKKTQDFDQIGKDATKDVDTSVLKSLEK